MRGISNCKLPMTEVEGIMIRDIHRLTMVYIIYTVVRGQICMARVYILPDFEFVTTKLLVQHERFVL